MLGLEACLGAARSGRGMLKGEGVNTKKECVRMEEGMGPMAV